MEKERELYNKFIDCLIELLESDGTDPKILNVILNFLKNNNIQVTEANEGLKQLQTSLISKLPFDDVDLVLKPDEGPEC